MRKPEDTVLKFVQHQYIAVNLNKIITCMITLISFLMINSNFSS